MKHLEDEDIARFVDGRVNADEREEFLKHFARCETCFESYTDALQFIEEHKSRKLSWLFPLIKPIPSFSIKDFAGLLFQRKVLAPAFAVLVLILVLLPWVINTITAHKASDAKIQYIEESLLKMEEMETYAFSHEADKNNAALRTGFFIEDLFFVLKSGQQEKLKEKITVKLNDEFAIIFKNGPGLPAVGLEFAKQEYFDRAVRELQDRLEHQSLSEFYQFGRFVERSILSTFEDRRSGKEEIEKYLAIAQKNGLPPGVLKDLKRLANATDFRESREICRDIKEVFL